MLSLGTFGGQKDEEDEEEEKFFGAGAKKNDPNESGFLSQSMGKVIMESTSYLLSSLKITLIFSFLPDPSFRRSSYLASRT